LLFGDRKSVGVALVGKVGLEDKGEEEKTQ